LYCVALHYASNASKDAPTGNAAPITYLADGKQYIVFALGGGPGSEPERLMALALP